MSWNKNKINEDCGRIYFNLALNKEKPETADIYFYSDIQSDGENFFTGEKNKSETSAVFLKSRLDEFADVKNLNIHINSRGGSVFEGCAIYSLLKQHKAHKTVYIDGMAASIASVIAMAGDEVIMSEVSMMMIHPAWTVVWGNSAELRKEADALDKMTESIKQAYLAKSHGRISEEMLNEFISAETWLTAKECIDYGFADRLFEETSEKSKPNEPQEKPKRENFTEKALSVIGDFFM